MYIPGETNVFADAPSRIYSNELNGIMHAESEYVGKDDEDSEGNDLPGTTRPLYTGSAAIVPTMLAPESHGLRARLTAWSTASRALSPTRLSTSSRAWLGLAQASGAWQLGLDGSESGPAHH